MSFPIGYADGTVGLFVFGIAAFEGLPASLAAYRGYRSQAPCQLSAARGTGRNDVKDDVRSRAIEERRFASQAKATPISDTPPPPYPPNHIAGILATGGAAGITGHKSEVWRLQKKYEAQGDGRWRRPAQKVIQDYAGPRTAAIRQIAAPAVLSRKDVELTRSDLDA